MGLAGGAERLWFDAEVDLDGLVSRTGNPSAFQNGVVWARAAGPTTLMEPLCRCSAAPGIAG